MTLFERYEAQSPRRQFAIAVFLGLLLLFLTDPLNLTHGYLEAEEGSTYLAYARAVGPLRAFLAPHQGYYSLVPNVTMMLPARWLPLVTAAWVGEWTAILFRLSTIYFIFTCESIRRPRTRLIIALLVSILPCTANIPGCIHSQFFLGAITAILLLSDPARHMLSRMTFLVIGGLSSPASCMFLPFYLLRAWKRRSAPAILQAAILTVCTAIQLPIIRMATRNTDRGVLQFASPWIYWDALVNHILILPFFTRAPYHVLSDYLQAHPVFPAILFGLLGVVLAILLCRVVWPAGTVARRALGIGFWSAFAIIITASGGVTILGGGERYYVAVNTCVVIALALALEHYRTQGEHRLYKITATLLIAVAVSGVFDIVRFFRIQEQPLHWTEQVADWKTNPAHVFRNGPWFWDHPFYLPEHPLNLELPYYTFDSVTRGDILNQLPPSWFQPLTENTEPKRLEKPIVTLKR